MSSVQVAQTRTNMVAAMLIEFMPTGSMSALCCMRVDKQSRSVHIQALRDILADEMKQTRALFR